MLSSVGWSTDRRAAAGAARRRRDRRRALRSQGRLPGSWQRHAFPATLGKSAACAAARGLFKPEPEQLCHVGGTRSAPSHAVTAVKRKVVARPVRAVVA
eukprot:scaffold324_cov394-Prasinococcus_capsulatus_cf.AAC.1